ncbi:hypothetical protein [Lichenifustis flavocetrariae]|uniref:Uncharacterized protein n=1 Tax=Lichenifustis flavocetrariae TaxID=2949735 RepID=A0AA42CKY1_9HYPH|nr:hypothetical protein [Lichenifustis flavocetrariae]MCW6511059.1 hypothetical protein [Lichenifustis flavocetrariae]
MLPLFVLSIVEDASVEVDVVALVPEVPVLDVALKSFINFKACAIWLLLLPDIERDIVGSLPVKSLLVGCRLG